MQNVAPKLEDFTTKKVVVGHQQKTPCSFGNREDPSPIFFKEVRSPLSFFLRNLIHPNPWNRQVFILDESLKPLPDSPEEFTGLLGVAGPQAGSDHFTKSMGNTLW